MKKMKFGMDIIIIIEEYISLSFPWIILVPLKGDVVYEVL